MAPEQNCDLASEQVDRRKSVPPGPEPRPEGRGSEPPGASREAAMAMISHELKTPLSTILMAQRALSSLLPERGPERRHLERIRRASERMDRLVGDLLDSSVIQAGQLALDFSVCKAEDLLADVMLEFEIAALARGISLYTRCTDDLALVADRRRIQQVLANLVVNALKFTPTGGAIDVRAERLEVGVLFLVCDTGSGIPADRLPCVFDRYWRARETASLGSGLGLFIAKGIVSAHGGKIDVESAVGKGTKVHFWLPSEPASGR
jgi:signal transduction histidine kinase